MLFERNIFGEKVFQIYIFGCISLKGLKMERKVLVETKYFRLISNKSEYYPSINSNPRIIAIIENQLNA